MATPIFRFKGFTDDWVQRKFGDVGSVSMCKRIFKEETTDEGDIPFFKIGTFGGVPDAYISRNLFEDYKAKYPYPNKGDILLSASGTIGRMVEYNGEEAYFQDSNIVWLSHDQSIDNRFLKVLYGIVKWDGIEGSTIQRLYNDNFLKTKFQMPLKEEQEKIGGYFANLDSLITLHQRKCDALKDLKKGMLQKMFPKEGARVPEFRFKGFNGDWVQRKLGDCCGQLMATVNPQDTPNDYFIEYSMPAFDDGEIPNVVKGCTMNSARKVIDRPCLLINKLNVRKKRIWNVEILGDNAVSSMEFVPVYSDKINLSFLKQEVMDDTFTTYLEDCSSGTSNSQKRVTPNIIMSARFLMPTKEEQDKIALFFDNIDKLITLHQRKCDALKDLKKGMLQKMFV